MARVLVVEDEPDILLLLKVLFESAGHEVTTAIHGAEALGCLENVCLDLVVTDLAMPVMDGHELISRLRAEPRTAMIPILVLSAHPDTVANADAVIVKPFGPDEILALARALLGGG